MTELEGVLPLSTKNISWLRTFQLFVGMVLAPIIFSGCGKSTSEQLHDAVEASNQAAVLFNNQNYVKALSEIHRAITLNTELHRDSALGENYLLLANCQRQLGAYDSSLQAFRASSEYFHLLGDQRLERRGRITLAELSYDLHNYVEALTVASGAAAEGKVFSDSSNSYQALLLMAKANHKLRNYRAELDILDVLLNDSGSHTDAEAREELWSMSFEAARGLRDREVIRLTFNRWRAATSGTDSGSVAKAYIAWGHFQESLSSTDSALRAYSQALNLLGGRRHRNVQAQVLTSLGSLSYRSKHFDNARSYYTDAHTLAKQENNIILEQSLNLMLVACDWKLNLGRSNSQYLLELEKRCTDAAAVCAQTAFLDGESFAFFLRGLIAERRNDSVAITAYMEALKLRLSNVIRSDDDNSVTDDLVAVIFDGENINWYDPLLRLLCSSGHSPEVFSFIEERNLREMEGYFSRLNMQPPDPDVQGLLSTIRRERNALLLLQSDIRSELAGGKQRNLERFESLKELLPVRLNSLAASAGKIDGNNFRWLLFPKHITTRMVRDTLPLHAGLVEYLTLENQTYILLLTRDTILMRSSRLTRQHVLSTVQEYSNLLGDARLSSDAPMFDPGTAQRRINELSPILYSWLMEPIQGMIGSLSKIYIVPPKEYGYLPFHTLRPSGGAPLINRMEINYLPSAAALLFGSIGDKPVREIVGVGHPGKTDWDVEYELKDIRGFFDKAKMYFDTSATLRHLSQMSYDLLHLAVPFTLDIEMPDSTGMTLSDGRTPDGIALVSLGAMMGIPPPQTLIISNINPKAGGLWRYPAMAALASGSQTVVLSMWQGERKSKKYFGEIFYTNLMGGTSSATSYHFAMMAMTKNEETSKLYQWGLYYQFGK